MTRNYTNIIVMIIIQWDKIMFIEKWRNPLYKKAVLVMCGSLNENAKKREKRKIRFDVIPNNF